MLGGERADHFVELSDEDVETSIAALKAHKSQVSSDVDERVKAWKARNGESKGYKYAESFTVFTLG